jgi:hypothetical protein
MASVTRKECVLSMKSWIQMRLSSAADRTTTMIHVKNVG